MYIDGGATIKSPQKSSLSNTTIGCPESNYELAGKQDSNGEICLDQAEIRFSRLVPSSISVVAQGLLYLVRCHQNKIPVIDYHS